MDTVKLIFLRHADTEKDPSVNAALWGLSPEGRSQALAVADLPIMRAVEVIYASGEDKTVLTAEPLARKLGQEVLRLDLFNEVARGDKFLTKAEFEEEKRKQLLDLSHPAFGGESGLDALARFKEGVSRVVRQNPGRTILIVTHGTILSIYFAYLLNAYQDLPERWRKMPFCAYGIVEDGVVVKDVI